LDYSQSDPIDMIMPRLATALWMQQFYLVVDSTYGTTFGEGWYDQMTDAYAGLDIDTWVVTPNQERWAFYQWAGDASGADYLQSDPISMDSAKAADAIWRHEYSLSIQSTYGTPIGEGWFEEMTAVPAGLDIGIYVVTPSAERFVFLQWTGDATGIDYTASDPIVMNGPKTAIAQWTHEYYLTVDTSYGTPTGVGWYEDGTQAYAGLDTDTYVVIPNVERYIFEGWDVGATGSDYLQSDPILMDGPKTAYAAWLHQYWMIVRAEVGGTPLLGITVSTDAGVVGTTPYSEWFNDGMTDNIGVEDPADVGGTDYEFLYWDYGPTDNPVSYTVAGSATIIAEYQEIAVPYFEVHISPVSRQIAAGDVTTYYVNVSSHNAYAGTVSLTLSGLVAPAQGTFDPTSVVLVADATEMSVLTISNTGSLTQTTHTLTVTGNDGTMTDGEDASLVVSGIAATGSISGTVTDQDLTLLAGTVVDLMVDQTVLSTQTTGSGGEFNFTDLSAGAYTVRASLSGYAEDNETVTLTAGGWETATLQLDEIRGSVSGVVRDVETSAIIDGATVEAYDVSGNLLGSDMSTATGRFLIQDLPIGTFDLRAWAEGYEMETVTDLQATVLANEVDVGDVYLTPETEPADAAGLADYWWVILIIAVVVVLLLVLVAKRRKPEEIEELDEEPAEPEEAETFEEGGLDELLDDEWLKEIE
ncbi:MAG: carboxypeptidase-like regulatory domain-containing protein, partial [Candidatus Thermoplasmatota archaeon]|nr:carboxypeptidase-like regulatory domain-containing protein [Candidatus Thermoplasmatota archaeon]